MSFPGIIRAADPQPGAVILQDLRGFGEVATVLMIAAHPDDENTQLITYLARGRGYRMAYLSVTRGDGGQNVLGPEFGEELGVIRTQELLAARRLDGGRQFFTRALDFGYSKDYRETLGTWDKDQVLSDVVRVIRTFRPDVVVTRFSTQPSAGQHGHHTASAVLGLEAFKIAGDPKAYPEQLTKEGGNLTPWQPKRIFMNGGGGGRGGGGSPAGAVRIDVSGNDVLTGESYGSIAGRSRAMHKSQGFDSFGGGRGGGATGPIYESFVLLDGEPATKDIVDGIDTTWARFPNGAEIAKLTDEAIASFKPEDPAASVPAILAIRSRAAALPADPIIDDKRRQLDRILQACLGLTVETTVSQVESVPGEILQLHHNATVNANIPVKWIAVHYPIASGQVTQAIDMQPGRTATRDVSQTLPAGTPLTEPYWLREQGTAGMFRVDDPTLIGRPENPPAFPVEHVFEVGGQALVIPDSPVEAATHRRMDVIPPVSLHFVSEVRLFAPGSTRTVEVEATASRANTAGTLQLNVPKDWQVAPATQSFNLATAGQHTKFTFNVTAPRQAAAGNITVSAQVNGARFSDDREVIQYNHIPLQLLQPHARSRAVALDVAIRGSKVGYLPGAGDSVADGLEQLGYSITALTGADLTPEKLRDLDAVVVGVRAFNVRTDLQANLPGLFAYAENGGNVIVQYNRPNALRTDKITPYSLQLSSDRITDETAVPTFLAPDHPALNTPNKITAADFDGWVQERGIYFPNQWDEHFTPIIAFNDPGEAPLKGGLLIAKYGKGYFVYTGLDWFRELPAGVPGAYRLFANLVSLGK